MKSNDNDKQETAYSRHKNFFNSPYLLTPGQIKAPTEVFKDFFSSNHLYQARESIAELTEIMMSTGEEDGIEHHIRTNAIHFLKNIELLVEAAYVVSSQKK